MNNRLPALTLDCKRYRIRIHGSTLVALDNPKYAVLIINPDDLTIGIMGTDKNEAGAHRLYPDSGGRAYVELISTPLLREINRVCSEIKLGCTYRLEGVKMPNKNIVVFEILNYTELLTRSKTDEPIQECK